MNQPMAAKSAGCFFNNPGKHSAGRLLDLSGCKGDKVGKARVSDLHANFIIQRGGARAADILVLSKKMSGKVKNKFGIILHREVELWGDF